MKNFLFHLTSFIFILTFTSCNNNSVEIKIHEQEVENYRKQKDEDYKIPEKTMLTDELRENFKGLKYFPIDYKYNIKALLTKLEDLPKIEIKTSTGKILNYVIYGKLLFNIDNKPYELSAYQSTRLVGSNRKEGALFVPFTDQTSGEETYGGGRYIVLDIPNGNELDIDFNMAFNPFCVYNPEHSCPIPPSENHLSVKIPVGELMY
ncbi:DUF1684 domain-containing protein [Olleya sp. AH-315-K02]|nr:DUF1684 domain-containing protein [Olleya sp. AH-315-K02]MBN4085379.1 DUF1684 domain-containing protein [Flavobacteriaceae bacterium AH-315-B10]